MVFFNSNFCKNIDFADKYDFVDNLGLKITQNSKLFNLKYYYKNNREDIISSNMSPCEHFYFKGYLLNKNPSKKLILDDFYKAHKTLKKFKINPIVFIEIFENKNHAYDEELIELIRESYLFDSNWYLYNYPDVANANLDAAKHYYEHGSDEERLTSSFFDTRKYKNEIIRKDCNPIIFHVFANNSNNANFPEFQKIIASYIGKELEFNEQNYLKNNPDLKKGTSYIHNLNYGIKEGRLSCGDKQEEFYSYEDLNVSSETVEIKQFVIFFSVFEIDNLDFYLKKIIEIKSNCLFIVAYNSSYTDLNELEKMVSLYVDEDVFYWDSKSSGIVAYWDFLGHNKYDFSEKYTYDYLLFVNNNVDRNLEDDEENYFASYYALKQLTPISNCFANFTKKLDEVGIVFPEEFYYEDKLLRFNQVKKENQKSKIVNNYIINHYPAKLIFPNQSSFWVTNKLLNNQKKVWQILQEKHKNIPDSLGLFIFIYINNRVGITGLVKKVAVPKIVQSNSVVSSRNIFESMSFDADYYLTRYLDIKRKNLDPLNHYLKFGCREHRRPMVSMPRSFIEELSEIYDLLDVEKEYLHTYYNASNLLAWAAITPKEHYEFFGKKHGYVKDFSIPYENQVQKFSIVVLVYNSAEFLPMCLDSAFNQNYKNVEVIIVNDGSIDGSQKIIDSYVTKYSHMAKNIIHPINKGLLASHLDGICASTGDYFTVLDGDDWLDSNFASLMIGVANKYKSDSVCCSWTRPDEQEIQDGIVDYPYDIRVLTGQRLIDAIVNWKSNENIHYGLNRKIYSKKSWLKFKSLENISNILFWEDGLVTTKFMLQAQSVVCIGNKLYNWYNNPHSVSNVDVSEKYINDCFGCLKQLTELCVNYKDVYERHVDNIINTELYTRLKLLAKKNKYKCKNAIKYLAHQVDENIDLFSFDSFIKLKEQINPIYTEVLSNIKVSPFVLFVDPVGISDLKNSFISYWYENSNIDYKYIQCDKNCSFQQTLINLEISASATLIVTTGGFSRSDFIPLRPMVQLWHGMGALKHVKSHAKSLKPIWGTCSSDAIKDVYAELNAGVDIDQIYPLGTFQSDLYVKKDNIIDNINLFNNRYPKLRGKKIYLWAPTFRRSKSSQSYIYQKDILDFEKLSLSLDTDEVFIVKYHPAIKNNNVKLPELAKFDNIFDFTDEELPPLLCACTCFVTDFSSSIFYACLLNKPIVCLATDIDEYSQEQGLEINYRESMPGIICESLSIDDLVNSIRNSDTRTDNYQKFKEMQMSACDGNSTERIYAKLLNTYKTLSMFRNYDSIKEW